MVSEVTRGEAGHHGGQHRVALLAAGTYSLAGRTPNDLPPPPVHLLLKFPPLSRAPSTGTKPLTGDFGVWYRHVGTTDWFPEGTAPVTLLVLTVLPPLSAVAWAATLQQEFWWG